MNFEKFTKAELISKLKDKSIRKDTKINQDNINSITIIDVIIKFKTWILSLTIITLLLQWFKNYKSIRAVLKLANYIVLTLFGMSIFEAFGFGFIVKFFKELRYVFGAVVAYLTDTTFYNYIFNMFNVAEENNSLRSKYKKPVETDWKAEYEKADRQREIEKWKAKYDLGKEKDGNTSYKTIALLILLLGGSIATWYYGPDLLNKFSPVWNMKDLIKKILKGGKDDDNKPGAPGVPGTPIDLVDRLDNISEGMLVYSSEQVANEIVGPPAPTAPPIPPAPPVPSIIENPPATHEGVPSGFLDQIRKGKALKKATTIVKDGLETGKSIEPSNTGSTSLGEQLKNRFSQLRPMITGDADLPDSKSGDNWSESGDITPTGLIEKSDKGKGKQKFLDAISTDITPSSSKISPALESLRKDFPNMSDETFSKLSAIENNQERNNIIDSLTESELTGGKFKLPTVELSAALGVMKEKFPNLSAETLDRLRSAKDLQERNEIIMSLSDKEIFSIQNLDERSSKDMLNIFDEKNLKSYIQPGQVTSLSHLKALEKTNEIFSSVNDDLPLSKDIDLFPLEAISTVSKINKEIAEESWIKDVQLDRIFSDIDKSSWNQGDKIKIESVDQCMNVLIDQNPGLNKQQVAELLIAQNPLYRKEILEILSSSLDTQLDQLYEKLNTKDLKKLRKVLTMEDLKERESLSEKRTVEQIQALNAINRSQNDFLNEIRRKSSSKNGESSTTHLEDTMNLFD